MRRSAPEAFLKAGAVGAVIGGLSGLGGALGGKLLSAVGGKALAAVGGLFGRGGAEAVEAGASELASSAASDAAESGASEAAASAGSDSASAAGSRAGQTEGSDAAAEAPAEGAGSSPAEGEDVQEPNCSPQPHSFVGSTKVLLASGTAKAISEVKVGDVVKDAIPGLRGSEAHKVARVIVTRTDHDFVDLKIAPKKRVVAAAVAVAAATLTTTFHHPFYDRTQSAFVEAAELRVGDELQTPTGDAIVEAKRTYHTTAVTYDLTIGGLHTYYVLAGNTPVLVHNCNTPL